jgi:PAS domain S-box-containing protein
MASREDVLCLVGNPKRVHGILTPEALLKIFIKYQKQVFHRLSEKKENILHWLSDLPKPHFVQEAEDFNSVLKKMLASSQAYLLVLGQAEDVIGFIRHRDLLPYFSSKASMGLVHQGKESSLEKEKVRAVASTLENDVYYFESFFTKAPFMMHSVNRDGIIQLANEMLHHVLGYYYPELLGRSIEELYTKENFLQAKRSIQSIIDGQFQPVVSSRMKRKDGKTIDVEITSRALLNSSGQSVGTLTISRPADLKLLMDFYQA